MKVLQHTFNNKSVDALKLWGEVMESLHHNETWNITIAVVTREHYDKYNADDEWIEGLANFLTILGDANAIMVLRQKDENTIKGSLRTTRDDIDLEKLARHFGGGGHKKASGFTINGNLVKKENAWYIS